MKKLEIRIGGLHHLHLNENANIISGEIVKEIGNQYLVYVRGGDYSYFINSSGKIIIYSPADKKVESTQEITDGVLFAKINMLENSVFVFNEKPIESEHHFYVKDMFCDNAFLLKKGAAKVSISYKRGLDSVIDDFLDSKEE